MSSIRLFIIVVYIYLFITRIMYRYSQLYPHPFSILCRQQWAITYLHKYIGSFFEHICTRLLNHIWNAAILTTIFLWIKIEYAVYCGCHSYAYLYYVCLCAFLIQSAVQLYIIALEMCRHITGLAMKTVQFSYYHETSLFLPILPI